MCDYIKREDVDNVIEGVRKLYLNDFGAVEVVQQIKTKLCNMPTADVQPVRCGEWISKYDDKYGFHYICSNCGTISGTKLKFCYDCGAKMNESIEETTVSGKYRNGWIRVEDQLPEVCESVLVCVVINAKLNLPFQRDDTPEIRIGWLDENGKWGLQFDSADRDEVLYWRPLPEMPNEYVRSMNSIKRGGE